MSAPQQPDSDDLLRQAVSESSQCLSIEQLDELARQGLGREQERAHAAHVAACSRCANELAMLREFLGAEVPGAVQADVQAVARSLEEKREKLLAGVRRQGAGTARQAGEMPWWQSWLAWFTLPRLSFASAALLVVVSAGLYLRQSRVAVTGEEFTESGTFRSGKLTGIAPSGDLARAPQQVSWNAVPGAQRYMVRLLEVDGNELWRTTTVGTTAALPTSATIHITFTKTLLLEVAAFDQAGKQIAVSEATRFRLMSRRK